MLSFEQIDMNNLSKALSIELPPNFFENSEVNRRLKIEGTYCMAVENQNEDILRLKQEKMLKFPEDFNYSEYANLVLLNRNVFYISYIFFHYLQSKDLFVKRRTTKTFRSKTQ